MSEPLPRAKLWAATMTGHGDGVVTAHATSSARIRAASGVRREAREERERAMLAPGAALASGGGKRAVAEEPDPYRTCFERDRDRIVHSTAFRRLAGKTQVVVYPTDHQRTRLTHALEVAQCAIAMARGVGANVTLVDAMALGHDCGHGPGGHASEDAFDEFIPEGYDHGPWGADVVLAPLNLCAETLDGIRNHSWSRPAPQTIEGEIVSWADRIAYCAHDLEDAIHAGIVRPAEVPEVVREVAGLERRVQLATFLNGVIETTVETGQVGLDARRAEALAELRRFNYERIYTRPESVEQSKTVVAVLRALVNYYLDNPAALPAEYHQAELVRGAVTYVGGMTDRFAFEQAAKLLGWDPKRLPRGIGRGA
ncbi:HD domain-containing protein [Tessaracoccus sp. OH4464_COT-324]|uniref:HD domain-containing protein n=1 Tax=Tessaracoccus sp. OH4464_COT-324 TaxID=2491059 RepID=UPI000F64227D|nr:HD domain-containing protein [Tessaracoccus sp. OH4464_COT-324]RRD47837.1 HD domain-containing protein [Tessaracoccus sp. OH4464_COT-324]